ncbi:MAG: Mur ligase domain-containing protein, partial [Rikenellaceae bacterium]
MKNVYFIGIGGIGMSAIARFFLHEGKSVAGYDRVATPLTGELEAAGVIVCYSDAIELIPEKYMDPKSTLVVYTPAVPATHRQLVYFNEHGFRVVKRSRILGEVSRGKYVMAVAGTHGKSSTTTMVAYFNHCGSTDGTGSAFLGAISKNFISNMVLGSGSRVAIEADEFDRSFLQLSPNIALITSVDADHLDIYGTHQSLLDGFTDFTSQIVKGGTLIYHYGLPLSVKNKEIKIYTYSLNDSQADFYATNIRQCEQGYYL